MILHLKDLLLSRGITSVQLAAEVGVSKTMVSYWMSGKNFPTPDKLEAIAKALDVPLWRLFADPREVGDAADADSLVVFMRYRNQEMILHTADEVLDMLHDWDVPKFLDSCRRHTIQALRDSYPADLRVQSLLDELSAAVRSL